MDKHQITLTITEKSKRVWLEKIIHLSQENSKLKSQIQKNNYKSIC
jgi:hypothetical protein